LDFYATTSSSITLAPTGPRGLRGKAARCFLVLLYESCLQKLASQRATSRAFPGRSIGRADGPDRASRSHFTKNPFNCSEINPRYRGTLRIFCKKHLILFPNQPAVQNGWALVFLQKRPSLYRKSTRAPETLSAIFAKTSSDFSQIKIQATFDYISFFSKNKLAETLKLQSKS